MRAAATRQLDPTIRSDDTRDFHDSMSAKIVGQKEGVHRCKRRRTSVGLKALPAEEWMDFSLSVTVLTKDLFAADGRLVASRGEAIDLQVLKDVAARSPMNLYERPLHDTPVADSVLEALESPLLPGFALPLTQLFADVPRAGG